MPWDQLLVASVRVILRHHGITSGTLVIDDTDNPRSKAAKALASLYKLRDKASGGYLWGQSLVFLVLVTPTISLPVGVVFYQPAPELSAWYRTAKALKKQGVPTKQRPHKPAPNPQYPTKEQLALRLLEDRVPGRAVCNDCWSINVAVCKPIASSLQATTPPGRGLTICTDTNRRAEAEISSYNPIGLETYPNLFP